MAFTSTSGADAARLSTDVGDRVVACESHQVAPAEQIRPRVTDVGEEQIVSGSEDGGQRRLIRPDSARATLVRTVLSTWR